MISMALKITGFLVLMLVIGGHSQPQVLEPENPTENIKTALSLFNGYYSNIRIVRIEKSHHSRDQQDVVNVTFIPVEVPAFMPNPAVYFEQSDNNVVYRQQVWVFSELDDETINIQPYNFTDPNENTPNTFDISVLMNLSKEDFEQPPEDCDLTFNVVEDDVIVGSMPDCKNRLENGQRPEYAMVVTCNAFSVVHTYRQSLEAASRAVYDHQRYDSRYPYPKYLEERLDNFEPPCDD